MKVFLEIFVLRFLQILATFSTFCYSHHQLFNVQILSTIYQWCGKFPGFSVIIVSNFMYLFIRKRTKVQA